MKKRILAITMIGALAFVSCNKEETDLDFTESVSTSDESLRLAESGYTINEVTPLGAIENDKFTEGVLEYVKDGELLARVDFADGTTADEAMIEQDGGKKGCPLEQMDKEGKGKKFGKGKKPYFKKVIVEPIVKTDDCDYIVSGIVKLFDKKSGDWVATIDFGDGTCDDEATKETADGFYTFTLKEHHK